MVSRNGELKHFLKAVKFSGELSVVSGGREDFLNLKMNLIFFWQFLWMSLQIFQNTLIKLVFRYKAVWDGWLGLQLCKDVLE